MTEREVRGFGDHVRIFGRSDDAKRCAMICEELGTIAEMVQDAGNDESSLRAWLVRRSAVDDSRGTGFFAWGPESLNTLRCMGALHLGSLGYHLVSLISGRAIVARDATIGKNTLIAAGAIVESGVGVADNCVIESGAIIGSGSQIGHSSWIGAGAVIAPTATIGRSTTLGSGIFVTEGVSIGEECELLTPGRYSEDVADRSFFHPRFEDVVRIYRGTVRRRAQSGEPLVRQQS